MSDAGDDDGTALGEARVALALLDTRVEHARSLLARLQQEIAEAESSLRSGASPGLLEANEQLVLAMLKAQHDAEVVARDIAFRELTASLRLETQRLGEENRQMKEASRLKSQFLANMSHELRTPLNAIIGFSELLRLGTLPPASPKYMEFLDRIISAGRYLLQLITGVLDLTKAASGKLDFFPEPVHLPEVVQEIVDMLQPAAGRRSVTLTTDLADLGELFVDRTRLKQILANFVSNAIKFSHRGGAVELRAQNDGDAHFRVEIQDHGIGIAAKDHGRLFVEFEQLDATATRRHEGTGIGLSLTRLLVEGQGGQVGLRSELGAGSTFFFTLPRLATAEAVPPAAAQ